MNNDNTTSRGIGFYDLLTIVFIVLKLCKVIAWKWVWVFAPLWMPLSIEIFFAIIGILLHK